MGAACLAVVLLLVVVAAEAASASGGVTLSRYHWRRVDEYVVRVPLSSHTIRAATSPSAFPLDLTPTSRRLKRAVAGTNSDFRCTGLAVPGHIFMLRRELWTTGVGHGGAAYMQGDGSAWVEEAHVRLRLDYGAGESLPLRGVNPCKPRPYPVLYTDRGGTSIVPPTDSCYTRLVLEHGPYLSADEATTVTDFTVGRTACKRLPLARPVIVSPFDPMLPEGAAASFIVDPGHPGVANMIGGDWLTVSDGVNVAPSHAHGKDCGIHNCPDGYMSGPTPRTALCVSPDNTVGYIMVADGKPDNEAGLTPPQEGRFGVMKMHAGACVNLDGGGSSVMIFRGRMVSKPSYGYQRNVIFSTGVFK